MDRHVQWRSKKRSLRCAVPGMSRDVYRAGHACRSSRIQHIAVATGPLAPLAERHVLVIVDDENITINARKLGYHVSYTALGTLLKQSARSCSLHAVFSHRHDDTRRSRYFKKHGWIPHTRPIVYIRRGRRREVHANADHLIAFTAGFLTRRSSADTIIVGSGDGELVCDIAHALVKLRKRRRVLSLSLAGSTSSRMDASINTLLAHNIEIGLDVLRPRRR